MTVERPFTLDFIDDLELCTLGSLSYDLKFLSLMSFTLGDLFDILLETDFSDLVPVELRT